MKKAISIFLSVLLLASSSGIAYAQHYCGGHEMMAKMTLGEEHLSCGMKMPVPCCEGDDLKSIEDHCCSNEYTQIETDKNFAKTSFDVDLDKNFVAALVALFVLPLVDNYPSHINTFRDYHPPPLDKDVAVLYQVFLI